MLLATNVADLNIKQVLYKSVNDENIGRAVNEEGVITEQSISFWLVGHIPIKSVLI